MQSLNSDVERDLHDPEEYDLEDPKDKEGPNAPAVNEEENFDWSAFKKPSDNGVGYRLKFRKLIL